MSGVQLKLPSEPGLRKRAASAFPEIPERPHRRNCSWAQRADKGLDQTTSAIWVGSLRAVWRETECGLERKRGEKWGRRFLCPGQGQRESGGPGNGALLLGEK